MGNRDGEEGFLWVEDGERGWRSMPQGRISKDTHTRNPLQTEEVQTPLFRILILNA